MPCIAAFDSSNLMPVAELWRGRHPQRRLVIAGDDDYELPLRTPPLPNVGREKATLAAHAANAALLLPNLGPGDEGLSDWNDVARRMGRDALANQVFEAVKAAPRGDWRDQVAHEPGTGRARGSPPAL